MNRNSFPVPRRNKALLDMAGITLLQKRNPYLVLWWSAAFPGFGHILLNQYLRGIILTLFEIIINTLANINLAIVYSFCGQFEAAKQVIHTNWMYGYLFFYMFSLWDSYRLTIAVNKQNELASQENARLTAFRMSGHELQFLDRKSPLAGALCSLIFPGFGQLYNSRPLLAFYAIIWWFIYIHLSRVHASFFALINGDIQHSTLLLNVHWLLFMPSVLGGAVYHGYITTRDHNLIFNLEQRQLLNEKYRGDAASLFKPTGGA